jgi:hypothetical protein
MFRIEDERSGHPVSVRFDGPVSGMVDQGDRVTVQGYMMRGVLNARRITDEHGAVLAEARCFVATMVYGDMWAPQVEVLRQFRSRFLERYALGRVMVRIYWRYGPTIARMLEGRPVALGVLRRMVFGPLCAVLGIWMHSRRD